MAIKKLVDLGYDEYDYLKIDEHQAIIQPDVNNITIYLKVCRDRERNSFPATSIGYDVQLDTFTDKLIKYYNKDDSNSYVACLYTALATLTEFATPAAEPILEEGQTIY